MEMPSAPADPATGTATGTTTYVADVIETLRVIVVGGLPLGVLIGGIGGRLAMFLLRITSPDSVGVTSDDGFVIGQVTLSGTLNLLMLGAAVGLIGAAAYLLVEPWLIGPRWLRELGVAAVAAALVGSLIIHPDGVDFTAIGPLWLAVGLFVALPAAFGGAIGPVLTRVAAPDSWTRRGKLHWLLPIGLVVCFPLTLPVVAVVALGVAFLVPARRTLLPRFAQGRVGWAIRSGWLAVAGGSAAGLVSDLAAF
jgi:hypothetical protein